MSSLSPSKRRTRLLAALAAPALLLAVLAGCDAPTGPAPQPAKLVITPNPLNVSLSVAPAATVTFPVTVTNVGDFPTQNAPLVTIAGLPNDPNYINFSSSSPTCPVTPMAPGASCVFNVTLTVGSATPLATGHTTLLVGALTADLSTAVTLNLTLV